MITYILECLAFQLVFLLTYDLLLKKETFFQWNRIYLIGTFCLSLLLPWVKIEALKTTVSNDFMAYPIMMGQFEGITVSNGQTNGFWSTIPIENWVYGVGAVLMALWFAYKLYQIYRLKKHGINHHFAEFTKIVVLKSSVAFSFFNNIFLGEDIPKEKEATIVAHELVHVKQKHSLDLLFFEAMRILLWFNPLVYVYQHRIAELHEFIADAQVAKTNKKAQYEALLSEVFQTHQISFVNQFFKKSLIKKRIIMLTKQKSKAVQQFKYALMLPLVMGMLVYTSCEGEGTNNAQETERQSLEDAQLITKIKKELEDNSVDFELAQKFNNEGVLLSKEDFFRHHLTMHAIISKMNEEYKEETFFVEFASQDHMPSSQKYEAYVKGYKALQIMDENLKNSIKGYGGSVRLIENDDEVSLSTSNILEVDNLKALSKDELIEFNALIKKATDEQPSDHGILVSDNTHIILVRSKKEIVEPVLIKMNDVEDRQQGLKSNQEPIIINTGEPTYDHSIPFAVIDEVPVFPGCENATDKRACFQESMINHIKKHFNYPSEAEKLGIEGRVNVIFNIANDGSIGDIKMRGPSPILETEVERIIKRLPKMAPGKHKGEVVKVPFSIPITFKLDK